MLRMSVKNGEYLMIGDDVKVVFLGGGAGQTRIMIDAPKEVNIARSRAIEKRISFLGICVGLQVLFENSEEAPTATGLGLLKGSVLKYKTGKTPQVGWNEIKTTKNNSFLTDDYFYFVNSYYVNPKEKAVISSIANYNGDFCASIEKENLCAVQFHPEKSGLVGANTIKAWLEKK